MRKGIFAALAGAAAIAFAGQACAATIYDSGFPGYGGPVLNQNQSLAILLTLGQAATVSEIEAYFDTPARTITTLTLSVFSGSLASSPIFSTTFNAATRTYPDSPSALSGLNLDLNAGDNYFVFSVDPSQTFQGAILSGTPNTLGRGHYFFRDVAANGDWQSLGDMGLGFRVTGSGGLPIEYGAAGIPEPGTWALMLTGVGLAGAVLRRRRVLATA